jgi:hypothetical protein
MPGRANVRGDWYAMKGERKRDGGKVSFCLLVSSLPWLDTVERYDNDCYQNGRMRENLPYLTSLALGYGNRKTNSVIGCRWVLSWNRPKYLNVITPSSEAKVIGWYVRHVSNATSNEDATPYLLSSNTMVPFDFALRTAADC